MDFSDFIVHYPDPNDENFFEKMAVKEEFRNPGEDEFFKDYQNLVGRWLSPYTNNNVFFLFWEPGVGKTRGALAFALMNMKYSKRKKTLFLASSEIILRSIENEVLKYYGKKEEFERGRYSEEARAHGLTLRESRFVTKMGFIKSTIIRFYNSIVKRLNLQFEQGSYGSDANVEVRDQVKEYIYNNYSDHNVVVDELHFARARRDEPEKMLHIFTKDITEALLGRTKILYMTATPAPDRWIDYFHTISFAYDDNTKRRMMRDISGISVGENISPDNQERMKNVMRKYAKGVVSYRKAVGMVPDKIPLPGEYSEIDGNRIIYTAIENEEPIELEDYIYPLFMSIFQTLSVAQRQEERDIFVTGARLNHDFSLPLNGDDEEYTMDELVTQEGGRHSRFIPSPVARSIVDDGVPYELFYLYYHGNIRSWENIDKSRGLAKHSIKFAFLIHEATYGNLSNIQSFVHVDWIEQGVKPLSAAFAVNGWNVYMGTHRMGEPVTDRFGNPLRTISFIYGDTKPTHYINIMNAANSENSRNGEMVRLIVGSRASSVSISFNNCRAFIDMSNKFHRDIQPEGRVFRVDSLLHLPLEERKIYTAKLVAFPVGTEKVDNFQNHIITDRDRVYIDLNDDEVYTQPTGEYVSISIFTAEVYLMYISQKKLEYVDMLDRVVENSSLEAIINDYSDRDADMSTYSLLYGREDEIRVENDIRSSLSMYDTYKIRSENVMIQMRAIASIVNRNMLVKDRYGRSNPIHTYGSRVITHEGLFLPHRGISRLSSTYSRYFFLTRSSKVPSQEYIENLSAWVNSLGEGYDFYRDISRYGSTEDKVYLLEFCLTTPPGFNIYGKRKMVLWLYADFWMASTALIVSILWYSVKIGSHKTKLGITSDPQGRTRYVKYDGEGTVDSEWRYIQRDLESVFLSQMAINIANKEEEIMNHMREYGYYPHFSLSDGEIRMRPVRKGDLREHSYRFELTAEEVRGAVRYITNLTDTEISDLSLYELEKKIFNDSVNKNILIIR